MPEGERSVLVETALGPWRLTGDAAGLRRVAFEGFRAPLPASAAPVFPWMAAAADAVRDHLEGRPPCYDGLPLHLPRDGFASQVLAALRRVPWGHTVTYGDLAAAAGRPGAARAAGRVMAGNPMPLVLPCHRVLPAGGRSLGGFSAAGGSGTKFLLLALEGADPPAPASREAPRLMHGVAAEAAHRWLARRDPRLGRAMETAGVWHPTPRFPGNPLASLVQAVVYQQLAGAAAAAIFRRLQSLFGCRDRDFPAAEDLSGIPAGALASAGLSRSKIEAIQGLAASCGPGGPLTPSFLEDGPWDEVQAALQDLRGVGPWTAEMFGIFHRGEPDLLPLGDLGVRRAAARLTRGGGELTSGDLAAVGRRWSPFRTVATWHLWRSGGTVIL